MTSFSFFAFHVHDPGETHPSQWTRENEGVIEGQDISLEIDSSNDFKDPEIGEWLFSLPWGLFSEGGTDEMDCTFLSFSKK
ncbi:hypothetical protein RCL_jg12075.t1 [Rhizophagus clarus]|uniref:Uncharacterized protein n=1 Tax=Rhizophagus clarus TaxID=94130 RepID=A0A8H3LZW8_9GLOM|nr:hypothetical protein RCL_jg12075.t1 [Rhizophagus clarus]